MGVTYLIFALFLLLGTSEAEELTRAQRRDPHISLTEDSVIIEVPSEERHKREAVETTTSGRLPLPHPPCFTSSGQLGRCTSFRECYPYFKIPNIPQWGTWMFGNQDTCSFFSDQVRQPDVFQTFGVCCTSPVLEPLDASPPIAAARPAIANWPPPIPTHPPDHSAPTHPPGHGIITHPASATTTKSPFVTVTHKPTTNKPTTWGTKPTSNPWKPTAAPTLSTTMVMSDPGHHGYGCGLKNGKQDQERIVGGSNADPNEWPWLVALLISGRQFCGGSLISNTHVLSAAHCVAQMTSYDVSRLTIRLGAHNIKQGREPNSIDLPVKRVVRHRGFDMRTLYNDVSVLQLSQPVKFNSVIRPICLATTNRRYENMNGIVIGWGSLRESGPQPDTLQKVSVPIWDNNSCRLKYGAAAPGGIVDHMICAGRATKDSCSGDSGGPLMVAENSKWTQVGVVSWGIGCGKGQYPGVYSRVSSFHPWIMKNSQT